jgi:hypothetical protein
MRDGFGMQMSRSFFRDSRAIANRKCAASAPEAARSDRVAQRATHGKFGFHRPSPPRGKTTNAFGKLRALEVRLVREVKVLTHFHRSTRIVFQEFCRST